ncbi:MAG: hypothetical protein RSD57_13500 [Comamonas sp.]
MTDILSEEQIDKLTKPLRQRAAQTRRLEKVLRCKLERRPDGLPMVTPDMLARLSGSRQDAPKTSNGLNWEA